MAHSMMMHGVTSINIGQIEIKEIDGKQYGVRDITLTMASGDDMRLSLFADNDDSATQRDLLSAMCLRFDD